MRIARQQNSGWLRIAILAIALAVVSMLALTFAPITHTGHAPEFVALLPLLLVGLISPLSLLGILALVYEGRVPQTPILASRFQRPPPFLLG